MLVLVRPLTVAGVVVVDMLRSVIWKTGYQIQAEGLCLVSMFFGARLSCASIVVGKYRNNSWRVAVDHGGGVGAFWGVLGNIAMSL